MAKRISQLPEETSVATGDQVPIYDASTGTTKRATVTNMLAGVKDGTLIANDAILARHINWAGTGADGGIWWEELGRTTLGSAGDTISIPTIPARKYLRIMLSAIDSGLIAPSLRFNNDSGNNYSYTYSFSLSGTATSTSQNAFIIRQQSSAAGAAYPVYSYADVCNFNGEFKTIRCQANDAFGANATTVTNFSDIIGKWASTSQVTRVDVINTGTGDFAIGSELIVLGHD